MTLSNSGATGPGPLLLWCKDELAGNGLVQTGPGPGAVLRAGGRGPVLVDPAGTPQRLANRGPRRSPGGDRDAGRPDDGPGHRFRVSAVADPVRVGPGIAPRPAPPAGATARLRDRGALGRLVDR